MTFRSNSVAGILFVSAICGFARQVIAADTAVMTFVYVCRDAGAGGYQAFPDVCRLQDGRLICVFYAGGEHISRPSARLPKGGRTSYCTSRDEGHSWSKAAVLCDTPYDDRDASIVQLKNGPIACNFFTLRWTPGERGDVCIVTSHDRGKTWSEPRHIYSEYYCSSPIRQLSTGRLILPLYRMTADIDSGAVGLSDDGGKTWSKVIDIPVDKDNHRICAETDIIELKDGNLYAAERTNTEGMFFSISKDRGETWSESRPIGFLGNCPYLLRTRDGIVILAYRVYAASSTNFRYSLDECKTWSEEVVVDEVIGAYPSMVNLKDGSVLIVYYEESHPDRTGSSIRAKRFRTSKTGVEWLVP
jgi:sialidase-1